MQVAEIMTSPPVTVEMEVTVHDAIARMLTNNVGSVVVTDTGVAGILTRSDVLRAAYHAGASLDDIAVSRAMSSNVVTMNPDTDVDDALATMETHEVKKLPVVEDFELVGIVTMTDIARKRPESVEETRQGISRKDEWT